MSKTRSLLQFGWLSGEIKYKYLAGKDSSRIGAAVGYYPNGRLRFKYRTKDGYLHGVCQVWHEDGSLMLEEFYERGHHVGVMREWFSDGVLRSHVPYERGEMHGLVIRRMMQQRWLMKERYNFGVRHGISEEWDEHGRLRTRELFLRGKRAPKGLNKLLTEGTLNARHILAMSNAEIRRMLLEYLGYERFLSQVEHQVLDRDGEQELVRIIWRDDEEPIYLLKVKCPSTGAFYTLRVSSNVENVRGAVAWTFGMSPQHYAPERET